MAFAYPFRLEMTRGAMRGGRIIAQGTPERVAEIADSHTGRYIATLLEVEVA